jgi:uncharacterized membrane protein YbhN (UPF0104 family)
MLSLALIAACALLVTRRDIEHGFIFWAVSLLLASCIIVLIFLFNKDLSNAIVNLFGLRRILNTLKLNVIAKRAYDAMHAYAGHKEKVFQAFGISLISHFIAFASVYYLGISLSVNIPFAKILLLMPIIMVLCMLPVTMNGLGLREWAFVLFFQSTIGNAAALSLSLLYLSMFLLISILGGTVYLLRR